MQLFLDVSGVTTGIFPPFFPNKKCGNKDCSCCNFDPSSIGDFHNYFTYQILRLFQTFGTNDPTLAQWTNYMTTQGDTQESAGNLPQGSSQVIASIISILNGAMGTSTFAPTIQALAELNQKTLLDPKFQGTQILTVTSTAYSSALLWSQVKDQNSGGSFLSIPKWLKLLAADIGGAIGGAGLGVLGALGGAVCGTLAAS